jgi:hypothetical protein
MPAKSCQDIKEPSSRGADEVIACRLKTSFPIHIVLNLGNDNLGFFGPCLVPGSALTFPHGDYGGALIDFANMPRMLL